MSKCWECKQETDKACFACNTHVCHDDPWCSFKCKDCLHMHCHECRPELSGVCYYCSAQRSKRTFKQPT